MTFNEIAEFIGDEVAIPSDRSLQMRLDDGDIIELVGAEVLTDGTSTLLFRRLISDKVRSTQ